MILDAATAVIQQNRNRKDKRLWTDRKGGRKIVVLPRRRRARGSGLHHPVDQAGPERRHRRHDRGPLPHQRAVASDRRLADARGDGVQDHRRRPVLRAQGDQGRAGLSEADHQPARRCEPATGDQRAGARRSARASWTALQTIDPDGVAADAPPLLAAGLAEVSTGAIPVGAAGVRRRRREAGQPGHVGVANLPRSDRRPGRCRADRVRLHRDRQDARSNRVPERPARRQLRRSQRANREPDGARVGSARLRDPRRRTRRSAAMSIGCRCLSEVDEESGHAQREGLADVDARGQGARVPRRVHGGSGGRPLPALAIGRERRRARRGAAALLRRDDARGEAAVPDRRRPAARLRRIPGDGAVTLPRRDPGRAGRAHRNASSTRTTRGLLARALRVQDEPVRPQGTRRAISRKSRPATRTRTRISPRRQPAPGHARPARSSSASARCWPSKSTTTISRSPCASSRSVRRSCSRNSPSSNRRSYGS